MSWTRRGAPRPSRRIWPSGAADTLLTPSTSQTDASLSKTRIQDRTDGESNADGRSVVHHALRTPRRGKHKAERDLRLRHSLGLAVSQIWCSHAATALDNRTAGLVCKVRVGVFRRHKSSSCLLSSFLFDQSRAAILHMLDRTLEILTQLSTLHWTSSTNEQLRRQKQGRGP